MLTKILSVRYVYVIAVAFTLINSVVFLLAGVRRSVEGYAGLYRQGTEQQVADSKLLLLESLDSFLIALVFLIFSLGIMKIFIGYGYADEALPPWLRIKNFEELKILLWESILVTLVVMCMSAVAHRRPSLGWDVLVLPAIVLVLAVGLYLMRHKES